MIRGWLKSLGCIGCVLFLNAIPVAGMDQVRVETRVDDAIARFGATGRGVIVAILDRGIDWRNNDFRQADGSTRIAWMYDLTDDSGTNAPGNTYGYGTIYSQQQINDALTAGTNLMTRDALGHGTTTAGIACGGGRDLWKYRGIAYEATLIAVKYIAENVPAHDNQPAETAFYDPNRLPAALQFVTDKAQALGMPCVVLLNIGSIGGPMDGSSQACQLINSTFGPGIGGRVFVTGASDDGGMANHAYGRVRQDADAVLQINKGNTDPLLCDLWYSSNDAFDVTIQTPEATFGPYASPTSNKSSDLQSGPDFLYYHYGSHVTPFGDTLRREIWVNLTGPTGTYSLTLHGAQVFDGQFDATLNPSRFWDPTVNSNYFASYVYPGYTIWDTATAAHNICPNDYVNRTNWVDIDGIPRSSDQGQLGDLWPGSGTGPTDDGRLGITVSAPGDSVFATYNPDSWWATFRFNLIQDGRGFYGRANAVSAASPIVTGIIALMLEMNPRLDATQVMEVLQESARGDDFTGPVPNPRWGYGKVDAYAALSLVAGTLPRVSIASFHQLSLLTVRNASLGMSYVLERSPDLATWTPILTNLATASVFTLADTNTPAAQTFYRVAPGVARR